jgi:cytoskeletal protein RodZ
MTGTNLFLVICSIEEIQAMAYHYGKTIREHRMQQGLTLPQLAEKWPSKETGVTPRYVSDIERDPLCQVLK